MFQEWTRNIVFKTPFLITSYLRYLLVTQNIISWGWLFNPVNFKLCKFLHPINGLFKFKLLHSNWVNNRDMEHDIKLKNDKLRYENEITIYLQINFKCTRTSLGNIFTSRSCKRREIFFQKSWLLFLETILQPAKKVRI